jgi:hypothetical protein
MPTLNSPAKKRLNALFPGAPGSPIDGWTTLHPYYLSVFQWLWDRLEVFSTPAIFVIIGPAGVGKSTLLRYIEAELIKRLKPAMQADPSLLPFVSGEAIYTPGVGVAWKGIFTDILQCANEPLIDSKVVEPGDRPGTLPGLYNAAHQLMIHRAPVLAMIDEASALVKNSEKKPDTLENNMHYLKGICNRSRTHLALFGDYSLADLAKASPQLRRRCHFAHLPPYPVAAYKMFASAVEDFERRFRLMGHECELRSSTQELFEGTAGCVGLLHRWLNDAYVHSRLTKQPITKSLLLGTAPAEDLLSGTRQQITEGEKKIAAICKRVRFCDPSIN